MPDEMPPAAVNPDQVEIAMAFLCKVRPTKKPTVCSDELARYNAMGRSSRFEWRDDCRERRSRLRGSKLVRHANVRA
jgi:hypothetical protein